MPDSLACDDQGIRRAVRHGLKAKKAVKIVILFVWIL